MSVVPNGIYKDNNENNDGVNGITFAEHLFVLYQYFFPHLTLQGSYKFKDFSRTFKYHIFKFQGSYLTFNTGSKIINYTLNILIIMGLYS